MGCVSWRQAQLQHKTTYSDLCRRWRGNSFVYMFIGFTYMYISVYISMHVWYITNRVKDFVGRIIRVQVAYMLKG